MEVKPSVVALQSHFSMADWLEYVRQTFITLVVLILLVMLITFLYNKFFSKKKNV